ncbi:unnamed protein product [Rotaria magnacalcarata]|uniref:Uncharacterized protein n=3 Tax=Rotaria magnacalcarata TaxID=392030 RepID=A0A816YVZ8_9BILA|nr:unnamed protein product [Rotaria magnacalcarata]CAF1978123.1 unnamed protein product [Rotaria magnacalcarata]CAF2150183.1 unnamed protein product [Rotaria magnacalcarata]CAF2177013.1 unnamed protein product [Rotaria magnacalcarata]CAF3735873.1 unnamed protein product [Rotaria magnacalcarata]
MALQVNKSEVVEQVRAVFTEYERALIDNDVRTMNTLFWSAPESVRYGIADIQHGGVAICTWRANCQPVSPQRQIHHTIITTFGTDFATVSIEFTDGNDPSRHGRQMQTWARLGPISDMGNGWKIVAAHVSLVSSIQCVKT